MDPLIIHHVIRHPLSRIETNNFQDKSGCSINGIRSFLFEEGMVRDLGSMERFLFKSDTIQDYRGYPIKFWIDDFNNFPLSDKILGMKNVRFIFQHQFKPHHKLVYPEPHFVEEERNFLENHFSNLGSHYNTDDIEEWACFDMDNEGHLVLFKSYFHFSNESIEHLSNFPQLRHLDINIIYEDPLTSLSLLSNLVDLSISFERYYGNPELFRDPEFLKDLGLFSNLLALKVHNPFDGFENYKFDTFFFSIIYFVFLVGLIILPPSFSNLSNLAYLRLTRATFQGFKKNSLFIFSIILMF